MKNKKNWGAGFTLAELLIAVTVIAIISTASISVYTNSVRRARDLQRIADMEAIRTALDAYYADHGHYPGRENFDPPAQAIPHAGQLIGIGDTCQGVDTAGNRQDAVGNCGWASIDEMLAPYMGTVPRDPLHDPNDDSPDFYYVYDPEHSIDTPDSTNTPGVGCGGGSPDGFGAVFGFYRGETDPSLMTRETCSGTNQNIDETHYNVVLFPQSP